MQMTKMDMIWVAVANMLYPETSSFKAVTRSQIESQVMKLFGVAVTPVMIEKHLVSSEDRQADKGNPQRGGSRNKYLFKTTESDSHSRSSRMFRLYKHTDTKRDGWDKTGPTHPNKTAVAVEYHYLIEWYKAQYFGSV